MTLLVKIYADKQGRQYQISIPKSIVKVLGIKHKDEFKLELEGDKIILTKCKDRPKRGMK